MKRIHTKAYYYPLITTYVLWTLWCVVMSLYPPISGAENLLRAIVRIVVILIPALIYIRAYYPDNPLEFLGLKRHKAGILWGLLASTFMFLISYSYMILYLQLDYKVPEGLVVWGSWIIVSPLAEELLFRVILFQELKREMRAWRATLLSSLFFVFIHLPPMILLNNNTVAEILSFCGQIFLISIILTYAFNKSKSLWGSLLPHWANNFISNGLA